MTKEIKRLIILQSILIGMGIFLILFVRLGWLEILPTCSIREEYGIICPTCGMTRCITEFLNMNLKEAFLYHPTFFMFILYIGIVNIIYILNVIFEKKYLKFLYPSIWILNLFLILYVIQYGAKIYMQAKGIGLEYL